jgi:hypothetical protein
MRPITIAGRVAAAVALVLLTLTLLPQTANAAAPTKIRDHTESIGCEVFDGSLKVQFFVARSDLAGTQAGAKIARDGEWVAEGYSDSDWSTPGAFRAAVDLLDAEGRTIHTAYLSGSYAKVGAGDRAADSFKDGNIRVVEDHTTWPLALSNIELVLDGVTLSGVDCAGDSEDGYLSYTNPSSYVSRGNFIADGDCVGDNANDIFIAGPVDSIYVQFWYADTVDWSVSSPVMDLTAGPFTGAFRLNDGTGPAGEVAGTASLVQNGDVKRLVNKDGVVSERWVMTPYLLTATAQGPNAPASVTCAFYQVEATLHVKMGKLEG